MSRKPRLPTDEERAEWREANKHTKQLQPTQRVEDILDAPLPNMAHVPPRLPAPAATSRALPALEPLSTRQAARQMKPHPRVEATLDLHGYTRAQAFEVLQQFLAHARNENMRHVLIITGKGKRGEGVLQTELPRWLNEPALRPFIAAISHDRPEKGGTGALHLLLKRL